MLWMKGEHSTFLTLHGIRLSQAFPLIAQGQNLIKDCLLFCSRSICLRDITEDQTHNNHLMSIAIKLEKETSSEKNNN